jgi:dTDP-3-amino-3,4,6-trideoxy-alpha-D-glucose transaminase
MRIPLFQPESWLAPRFGELERRLAEVLARGRFILGPEVAAFEREFAAYVGVPHAIGVANGTDAITIALRALGVAPGDEVIVPSFTFYASVEAAVAAGARPVFCEVDPDTRNVTVDSVRAVLSSRSRAIISVDLFGSPAPDLRSLGLPVLEDAAQAAGARLAERRAGALGDAATFSFYPSKNLPCLGDGGAIVTADPDVAERARVLRFHGSRDKEQFVEVGYNSRLDELQAAVLRTLLPHLDGWGEGRRRVAKGYAALGLGEHVRLPVALEGAAPAWHLYVVSHSRPDELIAALGELGVEARGYYRTPSHRQPSLASFVSPDVSLPVTDELARTNLALPMGPTLSEEEIETVVRAVASAVAGLSGS